MPKFGRDGRDISRAPRPRRGGKSSQKLGMSFAFSSHIKQENSNLGQNQNILISRYQVWYNCKAGWEGMNFVSTRAFFRITYLVLSLFWLLSHLNCIAIYLARDAPKRDAENGSSPLPSHTFQTYSVVLCVKMAECVMLSCMVWRKVRFTIVSFFTMKN